MRGMSLPAAVGLVWLASCSAKPPVHSAISITAPASFEGATVSVDGQPIGRMARLEPVKDSDKRVVDRILDDAYDTTQSALPATEPFKDWVFFDFDLPLDRQS